MAVVFCHIAFNVAADFPLGSMMPFVARTFLSIRSDRPHFCVNLFFAISAIILIILSSERMDVSIEIS